MRRSMVSLIVGFALAAIALLLIYNLRNPQERVQSTPEVPMVTVIVAKEDIPFGEVIRPDYLKEVSWPEAAVPKGAILSRTEALGDAQGDRIALKGIVEGEPILRSKLSGYGERPILSRKVPEDKRAYSIRINDVSGVAGFLLPGDRVDVLLTRRQGRDRRDYITDIIIQNVVVLGIDQTASEEEDDPMVAKSATIEVTPQQAQKLALAQQLGTLSLSLRGYTDQEKAEITRISVKDLTVPVKRPKSSSPGYTVKVRKGSKTQYQSVPR